MPHDPEKYVYDALQAARLSAISPGLATGIQGHKRIIGFRNIAVHAYGAVQSETVWGIVQIHLPPLKERLETMLLDLDKGKTT
jgi:uncharacterized protein YutE (UPF0331/DUF86 family)